MAIVIYTRMARIRWLCSCLECLIGFIVFVFMSGSFGDRTKEKIYIDLKGNMPCFRRLNATHQTGCTSKRGGNVGILQFVYSEDNITDVLKYGHTPPYVIALPLELFNRKILNIINNSENISGVLVLYPENKAPSSVIDGFSSDQSCPNSNYGMYRGSEENCTTPWNPDGRNILFEDWSFPIFIIREQKDIQSLHVCYDKFNSEKSLKADKWPYCAAELRSYMFAAKDSRTCIRRSHLYTNINPVAVCDPLGDQNIWLTLKPTNKSSPIKPKSLVVVAARIDAASLFDSWSPGAQTAVSGLVTLIAVAEALSKLTNNFIEGKNVLFTIFTGESFDYIGSSRMVFEMEKKNFPTPIDNSVVDQPSLITLETISHFVELSQLANTSDNIYMHIDRNLSSVSPVKEEIANMKNLLMKSGQKNKLIVHSATRSTLPPASLQSFLRINKEIPGIVLADHDPRYKNRFYNSLFDVPSNIIKNWTTPEISEQLARVASTVVQTVYNLVSNKSTNMEVNSSFITSLLLCYLKNSDCKLFLDAMDPAQVPNMLKSLEKEEKTYPLYVSVDTYVNTITSLTLKLVAYLTGEVLPNITKPNCVQHREGQIFKYFWMSGSSRDGMCVKSTVNFSEAVSPAFEIEGYDFTSGEYSTWTESIWENSSVRIFLKPSQAWEITVLVTGIIIFIVSFVIVWFFNRNAVMLFARSQVGC